MKKQRHLGALAARALVIAAAAVTVGVLALLLAFVLVKGVPNLNLGLSPKAEVPVG